MTTPILSRIEQHANALLDALREQSGKNILPGMSGADLLHERTRLMNLTAQGQRSANGSCHLLPCHDGGWIAINLPRDSDWSLLPALLERDTVITTLKPLRDELRTRNARAMVERGALLGLAIAQAVPASLQMTALAANTSLASACDAADRAPLVVDLSSLWAGPLCSRLLLHTSARVIEIHNVARPDGMALNTAPGAQEFYRRLHDGKEMLTLNFRQPTDMQRLHALISEADIVIEASRPRALQQLGIDAEQIVRSSAKKTWVSITGYGRDGENANRIAFGDDAAVSAGVFDTIDGKPCFIGDAIADPLTGLQAALTALTHWQHNTAALLDISLQASARRALR